MPERRVEEAIVEIVRVGNVLRGTAFDVETLTEVSVVGPLDAGEELLRRTAIAKLDYVLRKQATAAQPAPARTAPVALDVPTYGPNGQIRKIK